MKKLLKNRGFSAVEILVFIIIIAIIAAIAIPKLLESKRQADDAKLIKTRSKADEASAVLTLRAINQANTAFQMTSGGGRYGTLAELTKAELLDQTFAAGGFNKSGYKFSESVSPSADSFCVSAVPVTGGKNRTFGINNSGVIYAGLDDRRNAPSCSHGVLTLNGAEPLP